MLSVAPPSYQLLKTADDYLWPEIKPFDEGNFLVSSLHSLWFAQYGNQNGTPVLVVHGGPGGTCGPRDMRYFDPKFYRIILVDQRGALRSRPVAETRENTTNDLINDFEKLREHLGIAQWLLFGGSWGSALSLAYGQAHREKCLGFILRGVFLGTKEEYQKLWNGMGDIYPEEYAEYVEFLPPHERDDLLENYHRRLTNDDPKVHLPAARAFYKYDQMCASLVDKTKVFANITNDNLVLALSRIFAHYSKHQFFFEPDQLMKNLPAISHLPAMIVHGRYDVICRAQSAYRLHKAWPESTLKIIPDAGHASWEPGITKALVDACNQFKARVT
jgi:proline iminopeptidase